MEFLRLEIILLPSFSPNKRHNLLPCFLMGSSTVTSPMDTEGLGTPGLEKGKEAGL